MKDTGVEKRRARRRPVMNTFSLFVVIPRKGGHRLQINDLSEFGIGFDWDEEGESHELFKLEKGEDLELRLYLNQSLYLPLAASVKRVEKKGSLRRVGAEFTDAHEGSRKALASFLKMLDSITSEVRFDTESHI